VDVTVGGGKEQSELTQFFRRGLEVGKGGAELDCRGKGAEGPRLGLGASRVGRRGEAISPGVRHYGNTGIRIFCSYTGLKFPISTETPFFRY